MADDLGAPQESVQPTAPTQPAPPAAEQVEPVFTMTQSELNALNAKNRRNMQSQLSDAQKKAKAYEALQAQVSEAISNGLFEGVETLDDFAEAAQSTIMELQSEQERFAAEQNKTSKALAEAQQRADEAIGKFNSATIDQAIVDNCPIGDGPNAKAVSAGALNLVKMHLRQFAEVQPDSSVVFNMPVKGEDGSVEVKPLSAAEAIGQMEMNVRDYGTLFRSTVNAGTGVEVDGVKRTQNGQIDIANMDYEKFIEMETKNPGAIAASFNRK
jgi:hypothetical protein